MELHTKVERLKCPHCGEMAYFEIGFRSSLDEEFAGYRPVYQFCFKCGHSGTGTEHPDPEKDTPPGNHIPNALLALISLNFGTGHAEYGAILGHTLDDFVSSFSRALEEPDTDPNGSYSD